MDFFNGTGSGLSLFVLTFDKLNDAVVDIGILHEIILIHERHAITDMGTEKTQGFSEEVLVLLTCHINQIIQERFRCVMDGMSNLQVNVMKRSYFTIGVIGIRDIIEVRDTVFSVVERFPHHGRMRIDVNL